MPTAPIDDTSANAPAASGEGTSRNGHLPDALPGREPHGDLMLTPEAVGDLTPDDEPLDQPKDKHSFLDRVEAYISRLSTRNNFWHRVCSIIWLPIAAKSGIRMKRIDAKTFAAVLPFRRFNRNWYNAMAGAALLANSEIAGGMYVFGICGGEYTVVCKHLQYRFLRPCFGPAIYRIAPKEAIEPLIATGREFNLTVDMDIIQQLKKPGSKARRVGRAEATFHVTPKSHHKSRKARADKSGKGQ